MRPGLTVAVVLIAVVVAVTLLRARARGLPVAGEVVVRCGQGHLFTTLWVAGASFKAIRLGTSRFQRCPVGRHWSLVAPADVSRLSPEELEEAHRIHDVAIP